MEADVVEILQRVKTEFVGVLQKNKNLFNDSKDKKLITPPGVLYNSIINKG